MAAPAFPPITYSISFLTMLFKVASDRGLNVRRLKKALLMKELRNRTSSSSSSSSLEPFPHDADVTLLRRLALNALDLAMPVANELLQSVDTGIRNGNVVNGNDERSGWIQLSGHEGSLAPAGHGTVWKRRTPSADDAESQTYRELCTDIARDLAPKFYKEIYYQGNYYIEMQDLLHDFAEPSVMDIKLGTRTFGECEVTNMAGRPDLFAKMMAVDDKAATADEKAAGAVTKLRYMQFREQLSSTSTLGFRIEAVKYGRSPPITNLKLVKTRQQILLTLERFIGGRYAIKMTLLNRLRTMRDIVERSPFFQSHEIIGSSILMVHDRYKAGAWIIDFAKTSSVLPSHTRVDHRSPWVVGNREDGFLTGLDNLIEVLEDVSTLQSAITSNRST